MSESRVRMKLGPNTLKLAQDENGSVSSETLEAAISKLLIETVTVPPESAIGGTDLIDVLRNVLESIGTIQLMLLADVATDDVGVARVKTEIMRRDRAKQIKTRETFDTNGPRQRSVQQHLVELENGRLSGLEGHDEKGVER